MMTRMWHKIVQSKFLVAFLAAAVAMSVLCPSVARAIDSRVPVPELPEPDPRAEAERTLRENQALAAWLRARRPTPQQYWFSALHADVSEALLDLARDGHFEHTDWVYLVMWRFDDRYLEACRALRDASRHESVDPEWEAAFERMDRRGLPLLSVLESLEVHIRHDLPLALARSYREARERDASLRFEDLREDFEAMEPAFEHARKRAKLPLVERGLLWLFNYPGGTGAKRGRQALGLAAKFDIPSERAIAFHRAARLLDLDMPLSARDRELVRRLLTTELADRESPGVDVAVRDYEVENVLRLLDELGASALEEALSWSSTTTTSSDSKVLILDYLAERLTPVLERKLPELARRLRARQAQRNLERSAHEARAPDTWGSRSRDSAKPPPPPPPPGGSAEPRKGRGATRSRGTRNHREGGVRLDQRAKIDLPEITGAVLDGDQLVLLTRAGRHATPVDPGLFAAILRTVLADDDPYVSIDPGPDSNRGYVRAPPALQGTAALSILFEADFLLKRLLLARDPNTGAPQPLRVAGAKSWAERLLDEASALRTGRALPPAMYRFWITPAEVVLRRGPSGALIDRVTMQVKWERMSDQVDRASDRAAARWAEHLTKNWPAYARAYPALRRVEMLARLTAVAKYLRDARLPIDPSWYARDRVTRARVPETVKALRASAVRGRYAVEVWGGVDFSPENRYVIGPSPTPSQLRQAARKAKSNPRAGRPGFGSAAFPIGPRAKPYAAILREGIETDEPAEALTIGELTLRRPKSWLVPSADVTAKLRAEVKRGAGPFARQIADVGIVQPRPGLAVLVVSAELPIGDALLELTEGELSGLFQMRLRKLGKVAGLSALELEAPESEPGIATKLVWLFPPRAGRAYLIVVASMKGAEVGDRLFGALARTLAYAPSPQRPPGPKLATIAQITPNDTALEVFNRLGIPDELAKSSNGSELWAYATREVAVFFDADKRVTAVLALGPRAGAVSGGARVGSSKSELLSGHAGCVVLPVLGAGRQGSGQESAWCSDEQVFAVIDAGRVSAIGVYGDANEMLRTAIFVMRAGGGHGR
ncbi:MAG TPA: DUF5995 family protein [Polyangiaceae bacterium]